MDFWCYAFPMLALTVVVAFGSLVKDMKIYKLEQRIRMLEQSERLNKERIARHVY